MMFVPLPELMLRPPLKTVDDCVKALEEFVAPHYKNEHTSNIQYTRSECFGVLRSFFTAHKLSTSLTSHELHLAVQKFMEESLWITPEQYKSIMAGSPFDPEVWFEYPLTQQVKDAFQAYRGVFAAFVGVTAALLRLLLTDVVRVSKHVKYRLYAK